MDDLDGGAMRLREMGKGVWILGGFFGGLKSGIHKVYT